MAWLIIPWALGLVAVFCLFVTVFGLMDRDRTVNGVEVLLGLMIAIMWPVSLPVLGFYVLLGTAFGPDQPRPIRYKPPSSPDD